ncbi:MAG: DNA replication and repair protein RecF [Oscillospiraceae bacterium]|nr:DNA replication and repair protein RecF [Oscillospiraceae bacterium]
MRITEFSADGFRNLRQVAFAPDPKLNLITGNNAQGKTNLLDALWLMTGCRSFHGIQERHYLGFSADYFQCCMKFWDSRRVQEIRYSMERKQQKNRSISVNGVPGRRPADLFETFQCVAFSPADLSLIDGTPEKRRSFVDLGACQLHPDRMCHLNMAAHLLSQRNAGIQQAVRKKIRKQDILLWDEQLAKVSILLTKMRSDYIRNLSPVCKKLYDLITDGQEELELSYRSAIFPESGNFENLNASPDSDLDVGLIRTYQDILRERLEEDFRLGYTLRGIHRDELQLAINGKAVHLFGSQGQKKTAALVLKLAQAHLYREKLQKSPVILLDDVMGELDGQRQKLIYDAVSDMQVFITLCHASSLKLTETGRIFRMEDGILNRIS